jgi:hypothetical protein
MVLPGLFIQAELQKEGARRSDAALFPLTKLKSSKKLERTKRGSTV